MCVQDRKRKTHTAQSLHILPSTASTADLKLSLCVCVCVCVKPPGGASRSWNRWKATGVDKNTVTHRFLLSSRCLYLKRMRSHYSFMWVSRDTAAHMVSCAILICHIYFLTSLRYSTDFEVSVSKIAVVQWFESSTHQSNTCTNKQCSSKLRKNAEN